MKKVLFVSALMLLGMSMTFVSCKKKSNSSCTCTVWYEGEKETFTVDEEDLEGMSCSEYEDVASSYYDIEC